MCKWGTYRLVWVLVPADLACEWHATWKWVQIDACIADIVDALQKAGINMRNSCCGHGKRDGEILLEDGRTLTIHSTKQRSNVMRIGLMGVDLDGTMFAPSGKRLGRLPVRLAIFIQRCQHLVAKNMRWQLIQTRSGGDMTDAKLKRWNVDMDGELYEKEEGELVKWDDVEARIAELEKKLKDTVQGCGVEFVRYQARIVELEKENKELREAIAVLPDFANPLKPKENDL